MASDGQNVYVPYSARAGGTGPETLVVQVSTDRGVSWPGSSFVVAAYAGAAPYRQADVVARQGGVAWAFWHDDRDAGGVHLWSSRTRDAGRTWTAPVRVDSGVADEIRYYRSVVDSAGNVLVALQSVPSTGVERIRFTRSVDEGDTWSTPQLIDGLAVAVDCNLGDILSWPDGQVLVAWSDKRNGEADAFTRVSRDGGVTWTEPVQRLDVGDAPGATRALIPKLARTGQGKELSAIWIDWRAGLKRIFGNFSPDGGLTWGEPAGSDAFPISAPASDGNPIQESLAGSPEGWVTAAWRDAARDAMARCGGFTCPAAFFSTSCDGGRTWEADAMILDTPSGVNTTHQIPMPFGASVMIYSRTGAPEIKFRRIDGPTGVFPRGPTTYCVGNDPLLEASAVAAGCPGGLTIYWFLDGVEQTGVGGPSWQPSLAVGDHVVEVRGACFTDPTCALPAIPLELHVRAPATPPDIGNNLRAVRVLAPTSGDVLLDWSLAPRPADVHSHPRRSDGKGQPWSRIGPEPLEPRTFVDSPPASTALWLYDVRQADVCEAESAN